MFKKLGKKNDFSWSYDVKGDVRRHLAIFIVVSPRIIINSARIRRQLLCYVSSGKMLVIININLLLLLFQNVDIWRGATEPDTILEIPINIMLSNIRNEIKFLSGLLIPLFFIISFLNESTKNKILQTKNYYHLMNRKWLGNFLSCENVSKWPKYEYVPIE